VLGEIVAEHGRIDVLVNNAGIKSDQSALEGDLVRWNRTLDINARSVLIMSRFAIRGMRAGGGRIINIGSSVSSRAAVFNYQAGGADYCLSKAMVHSTTQLLAYEAAKHGITVNAIAPGIVDTPLHGRPVEETEARHAGRIPLERVARPDDLVGPVLFLASDGARYVTGQILHVNGGMVMEP
jgi:3-oxoacyl-[acyl-carrier protein] reductase